MNAASREGFRADRRGRLAAGLVVAGLFRFERGGAGGV